MTSLRVDQACHDPLTLWALILEDEEAWERRRTRGGR